MTTKFMLDPVANEAPEALATRKKQTAEALGIKVDDVIASPFKVTVLDVPGPSVSKAAVKKDKEGHTLAPPAEITRLCKQLHEDEDGPDPHAETHEETIKLLTDIGETTEPELRRWAGNSNNPAGAKRCADLADTFKKKPAEEIKDNKSVDNKPKTK